MQRKFLISYTVKSQKDTESCQDLASDVRKDIAKIEELHEIQHLETTRYGWFDADSTSSRERRDALEQHITKEFKKILKEHEAHEKLVIIYCSMMLENSGGEFHFNVSYR